VRRLASRRLLVALWLLAFAAPGLLLAPPAHAAVALNPFGAFGPDTARVPGEWLVSLRDAAVSAPTLRPNAADTLTYAPDLRTYTLVVAPNAEREAVARLLADTRIAAVEPNARVRAARVPNDPGYPAQAWSRAINLEAAWDMTTGAPAAVIAVIDTEIAATHPDLAGRVLPGYDALGGDAPRAGAAEWHGTAVALLAAGRGDNGAAGAGVAWGARILPVRVLGGDGKGTTRSLVGGMRWAVEHGATIINLSVTAEGYAFSRPLASAVAEARARGIVVVSAVGDGGPVSYPENDLSVIAVSAADANGAVADFSRRPRVDVIAPGVGVPVSLPDRTISATGSSFAAPLVSGTVALMQSVRPDLRPEDARALLARTAKSTADGGAGMLDAGAAVRAARALPSPLPPLAPLAYRSTYDRTDAPVVTGATGPTARGYLWGPGPVGTLWESYAEAPGGQRQVWYFDKGRLEPNDAASGAITSGLLVTEMVTGRVQTGNDRFERRDAALAPLVGDLDAPGAVGYAALLGPRALPPRVPGAPVAESLAPNGTVAAAANTARHGVATGVLVPETRHAVASVFADYLAGEGPVQVGGRVVTARLFDPPYALVGLPITEAYWVNATVGGRARQVLVQAFERRVLTYNPDNPEGFRVEMGNVGLHYLAWRYGG